MNTVSCSSSGAAFEKGSESSRGQRTVWERAKSAFVRRPELLLFLALTLTFSAPVLLGTFWRSMIFLPEAVREGEWWRLITHPFVHVTWFHLLLDGVAFLMLYESLLERMLGGRLFIVSTAAAGSLAAACLAAPALATGGLCGLSAIAHGLMAVSAVEMMAVHSRFTSEWRVSFIFFLGVAGKAALEALTGKAMFGFLYFELMGDPVAVSHAGGIVGGLAAWLLLRLLRMRQAAGSLPGESR